MNKLIALNFILMLWSCNVLTDNWQNEWNKHQNDFKQIVGLVRENKLRVVYGRMGYAIPDTFKLQSACGQIVFRETDFTYDSSYSILFRLQFDTNAVSREYPMIVYTDNKKRIIEYEALSNKAVKIEKNWYFIRR